MFSYFIFIYLLNFIDTKDKSITFKNTSITMFIETHILNVHFIRLIIKKKFFQADTFSFSRTLTCQIIKNVYK